MPDFATGTIYTRFGDTWASLESRVGVSKAELIDLNPHIAQLSEIEAGVPIDIPLLKKGPLLAMQLTATPKSAFEVAKTELLKDIAEIPGPRSNPRITLYHSTTTGGAAPDDVAWCSSFVNYCVEQSGLRGTDSKGARSWLYWGVKVEANDLREGDIVVFWRGATGGSKGHVGFLVGWDGAKPDVLGGNQHDRLCIDQPYGYDHILSVRRAR